MIPERDCFAILQKYVTGVSLQTHCFAVEAAMRAYGGKFAADPDYWAEVGLLHDIDFERYPAEHLQHTRDILRHEGFSTEFITDVLSHDRAWQLPRTVLQRTLLAVDELTGFILACALVRPDKSLAKLESRSVMKKLKDKAFARAVDRELIRRSAADLGVTLEEHVVFVIQALVDGETWLKEHRGRALV